MNNKELKHKIKQVAITTMPDVYSKIDLKSISIPSYLEIDHPIHNRSKSSIVFVYVASLAILVTGTIVGYDQFIAPRNTDTPLTSEAEIIGFPMVSSVSLVNDLSFSNATLVNQNVNRFKNNHDDNNDLYIISEIDNINSYVNMSEILLGDKNSLAYDILTSDNQDYDYMMRYTAFDLLNQSNTYVCYYNHSIDANNNNKTNFDGIMVIDTNEYELDGSIFSDGENTHSEFIAKYDSNNYVEVTDQVTDSIHKYEYTIYQNGEEISSFAMKLVMTDGKVESKIDYSSGETAINYRLRRWVDNSNKAGIYIDYDYSDTTNTEKGNIVASIIYDEESSSYEYAYELDSKGKTTNWSGNRHNGNNH